MPVSDESKNRGAHGDSSFMLGGVPSSSENLLALAVGSVKKIIEEGDDVVIRKKKRDGKLVYIVYQQSMKIRAIIPCDK